IKLAAVFCKEMGIAISGSAPSGDFDVAINAAPDPDTLMDGLVKLKAGGKFCIFSGFTKNVTIPSELLNAVHYRQLTIVGAYGSTKKQMETALTIFEKHPKTLRLLIHKIIPLEEVPSVLPEILQGQSLKYVVDLQNCDSDTFGN
ncbi:MAG TPA: hypothetical protein VLH35_08270, partial [Candidatus Acidoferrales bacterium]|nr:hypothetical protein [Candidatus Acidoferrales bacterium]